MPGYRVGVVRRGINRVMGRLVRAGWGPGSNVLLTTVGRKTGEPRTTPVTIVERDGRRWLVAPYGPVGWVHNARAAGSVELSRGGESRAYTIREVTAEEAGPVLRRYLRLAPITKPYFTAGPGDPDEAFAAEAAAHPVFALTPTT